MNIDLHEGLFSIPGERVAKLRTKLKRILLGSVVSARELAKVTGLVLSIVVDSIVNSRVSWNREPVKPGLWTLDWTMDWTLDCNMDCYLRVTITIKNPKI